MTQQNLSFMKMALALAIIAFNTGCHVLRGASEHRYASSLLNFLYPEQSDPRETPAIPVLSLPLRVGVAFVPEEFRDKHLAGGEAISEPQKIALLKDVSESFRKYPFVKSIEIIPSAYVAPRGGFENVDQIRSMFGVDVIALVSYDQVQFTDEGLLSLTYWTIVGAYVVQGEKNDTQTMLDTAVYDIKSRTLLFRGPGLSRIKHAATPVNLAEQLRNDRLEGFTRAATNMVENLHTELESFQERVQAAPEEIKVVRRPGYTGGGSLNLAEVMVSLALGFICLWIRRSRRA